MKEKEIKELRKELLELTKVYGFVPDEKIEKLEDKYHVDLTSFYGDVNNLEEIDRLINKIKRID